jgi:hypothetical protein
MNQVDLFFLGLEPEHQISAHDVKVDLSSPNTNPGFGIPYEWSPKNE